MEKVETKMQYRRLGRTGLKVSVIGVGTWQYGGEWGREYRQDEVDAILDRAAELGVNLIDTAECYGDHLSESLIGNYLSRRDRARWIVATKFGHRFHSFMNRSWDFTEDGLTEQLEKSLRALRIEAVDVYQFHSGSDEDFSRPEVWELLARLQRAGKIRHLGISISSSGSLLQAREASRVGAEALQVVYNRLERRAEQDYFPAAREQDLGIMARVPLASGLLTGKYTSVDQFAKDDVRSTFDSAKMSRGLAEVESIKRDEVPAGVPMAQWALAWCLKDPVVSCVIPGSKDVRQLEQNLKAVELL